MLVVGVALVAAACGGAETDTASPTVPSLEAPTTTAAGVPAAAVDDEVDPEAAFLDFAQCMREQGIDMPDPDPNGAMVYGGRADFEAFEAAAEECDPTLEGAYGSFDATPELEAEMRDAELAMSRCMREHGIDMPDPDPANPGMIEFGGDLDTEAFEEALDTCSREAFGESGSVYGGTPGESGYGGTP